MVLGMASSAFADRPSWSKEETLKQVGSILYVVCDGAGPSRDLARKFALDSCLTTAANQVNSNFKVTSLSLETEKSVNFHSEVSSNKTVTGLVCNPQSEYSEEKDGQHFVWLKCIYDTSKAKVVSVAEKMNLADESKSQSIVQAKKTTSYIRTYGKSVEQKGIVQSSMRSIALTSIPRCDSVLIRGAKPRSVNCEEMPLTLTVLPDDREIIVRSSGFLPKHIQLDQRRPSTTDSQENLEVYLERN